MLVRGLGAVRLSLRSNLSFSVLKRNQSEMKAMFDSGPHIDFLLKVNSEVAKATNNTTKFRPSFDSMYRWLSANSQSSKALEVLHSQNFIKKQYQLSILRILMGSLGNLEALTPDNKQYISNIIIMNTSIFYKLVYIQKDTQALKEALRECLMKIRMLIIFLQNKNIQTIHKLVKLYDFIIIQNGAQGFLATEMNGLNVILIKLINSPNFQNLDLKQITLILYFFSKMSRRLSSLVHDSLYSLVKKIIENYPNWYKFLFEAKSIMFSVATEGTYCERFKEDCLKALDYVKQLHVKKGLLCDYISNLTRTVLMLRIIDSETLIRKYPHIVQIIETYPLEFIKYYFYFVKSGLWLPKFWVAALKKLEQDRKTLQQQYFKIYPTIHSIYLFKDEMGPSTFKLLDQLIRSSPNLTNIKNLKEEDIFNSTKKRYYEAMAIQMNFQQLNLAQVLASKKIPYSFEKQVRGVLIDLFIGQNIIVQIHGPTHFIRNIDKDERKQNLSSIWKRKYIQSLSKYKLIQVDLSQNMDSAARLIKQILY